MGWVLAAAGILVTLYIASLIDDWGRDLTTNVASTSDGGDLAPVAFKAPPQQAAQLVSQAAAALARWQHAGGDGTTTELHFVRTTPLLRFKDDVHVRLHPQGDQTVVHIRSRSRLGRGDLGQNPRNIQQLIAELNRRGAVPCAESPTH